MATIPPSFCAAVAGTWKLDAAQSDPMEPLLKLLKVPWIARKAAASAVPVTKITATAEGMEVVQQGLMNITNSYKLGQTTHKSPAGTHDAQLSVEEATADGTLVAAEGGAGAEGAGAGAGAPPTSPAVVLRTTMNEGKMQAAYCPATTADGKRAILIVITFTSADGQGVRLRRFFVEKK
jgi:hypothetical protein